MATPLAGREPRVERLTSVNVIMCKDFLPADDAYARLVPRVPTQPFALTKRWETPGTLVDGTQFSPQS